MKISLATQLIASGCRGVLLIAALNLAPCLSNLAADDAWIERVRNWAQPEATLHSVAFVDEARGVAVGEHGVAWRTTDCGATWRSIQTPSQVRLNAVAAASNTLFAVGAKPSSYSRASQGMLLTSADAGATWQPRPTNAPGLHRIVAPGRNALFAAGADGPLHPFGALQSGDGGRSWQSQSPHHAGRCVDVVRTGAGFVALTAAGELLRGGQRLSPSLVAGLPRGATLLGLAAGDDLNVWAYGTAGAVLLSLDGGRTFSPPVGNLPTGLQDFDVLSAAVDGDQAWFVGAPGNIVLHTPDAGRNWNITPANGSAPLHGVQMTGETIVAVGAFGRIERITSGVESFKARRAAPRRAGVLIVATTIDDVPWEWIAKLAIQQGRLVALQVVAPTNNSEDDALNRVAVVHAQLGGAYAADFFLSAPEEFASTDLAVNRRLQQQLTRRLVRDLRMWRPDVLIVSGSGRGGDLLHQVAATAATQAERLDAYPEQLTTLQLAPWRTAGVHRCLEDTPGDIDVVDSEICSAIACSYAEMAAAVLGPLSSRGRPKSWGLMRVAGDAVHLPASAKDASRATPLPPFAATAAELTQRVRTRRLIERLIEKLGQPGDYNPQLAQQAVALLVQTPGRAADAQWIALADAHRRNDRLQDMIDVWRQYLDALAPDELGAAALALRQVAAAQASEELNLAMPAARMQAGLVDASNQDDAILQATYEASPSAPPAAVAASPETLQALLKHVTRVAPQTAWAPKVQYPLAAWKRRQGLTNATKGYFRELRNVGAEQWRSWARAELQITDGKPLTAVPTVKVVRAETPPRLDGEFDEPCWQVEHAVRLPGALRENDSIQAIDSDNAATVYFAYDEKYFYIAAQAALLAGDVQPIEEKTGPRLRDADLSKVDHLTFYFDADRDLVVRRELSVDATGRTHDACWGSDAWNPRWYVAAERASNAWRVEIAVPLTDLRRRPVEPGEVWAVACNRAGPHAAAAWPQGATAERPEYAGAMVFEERIE